MPAMQLPSLMRHPKAIACWLAGVFTLLAIVGVSLACTPPRGRVVPQPMAGAVTETPVNVETPAGPEVQFDHPALRMRRALVRDTEYMRGRRQILEGISEGTITGAAILLVRGLTPAIESRPGIFVADRVEIIPQREEIKPIVFMLLGGPPQVATEPVDRQPVTYELTALQYTQSGEPHGIRRTSLQAAEDYPGAVLRIMLPNLSSAIWGLAGPEEQGSAHIGYWQGTDFTDPAAANWITSRVYHLDDDTTWGPFPGLVVVDRMDKGASMRVLSFSGGFITPDETGVREVLRGEAWLPRPILPPPPAEEAPPEQPVPAEPEPTPPADTPPPPTPGE